MQQRDVTCSVALLRIASLRTYKFLALKLKNTACQSIAACAGYELCCAERVASQSFHSNVMMASGNRSALQQGYR